MTLTTGLAPLAADAPALRVPGVAARHPARRLRAVVALVALDLAAAALAATLIQLLVPVWSPAVSVVLVLTWPAALGVAGGYAGRLGRHHGVPGRVLLLAGSELAVTLWVTLALVPGAADETPRQLATGSLLLIALMPALTLLLRFGASLVAPRRPVPAVLVGDPSGVRTLLHEARRARRRSPLEPVAACLVVEDSSADPDGDWPVQVRHGGEDQLLATVLAHGAGAVVAVPGPGVGHAELRRWGAWLQDRGVELLVSSGLRDVAHGRLGLASLGGAGLLHVRPARLSGPGQLLKGAVDRTAAALLLLMFGPLLGVLTLLIRADSPGPGLYRQTRIGRNGQPFTVYKLRTMRSDAERVVHELADANESDRDGVLFKIRHDPRITRLGAVLRAYSLDELPQLWNVLRGEMSLVGPRPALPDEVRAYPVDVRRRLAVNPGMTGLWQVSGRSDLSWEDTVRLDLQYVDNWSWALDLRIALRTASAVLGRRGAY